MLPLLRSPERGERLIESGRTVVGAHHCGPRGACAQMLPRMAARFSDMSMGLMYL